jgi:hypothetical protein
MIDDFQRPSERPRMRLDNMRRTSFSSDGTDAARHFDTPDSDQDNQPGMMFHPDNPAPAPQSEEPAFRPPEEVSQEEQKGQPQVFLPPLQQHPEIGESVAVMERQKGWKRWFRKPDLTRKQWIIVIVAAVIVLGSGSVLVFKLTHKAAPVVHAPVKVTPKPAPAPILSPLSGLPVTQAQHDYPVVGVMIENSPAARPQSGLDQAGVVYEAIAEAGITRFLALYQENSPGVLGPVRSSRPYYLDWAMAFDASYAHVGGSPDALQRIKDIGVRDLDQFFNPGPYHRISTRYAPHNMYTSLEGLRNLAISKGWSTSKFTPFVRKAKEEPSKAPTAKSINIGISGADYNVHYDYDPASNSYKRSEGGEVHIDNETKAQLSPKVVITLAMPYSLMDDGYHSQYQTQGSGNMLMFQDGVVTQGTWSKAAPQDPFIVKDGAGADMKLNPGQTWITVVDDIGKVTYQP